MSIPQLDNRGALKLTVLLLAALGVWILAAPHWGDLTTTQSVGGLLGNLALVIGAAFGVTGTVPPKGLPLDRGE